MGYSRRTSRRSREEDSEAACEGTSLLLRTWELEHC